jgi:hydrogenase nickel incorporation protein HypA/HybF
MHELSMAQALIEQVEKIQAKENAGAVVSVTVNIGALSGVDREAFEFAFPLAATGTPLAGALLVVRETPAEVTCGQCGQKSQPELDNLCCAACGSRSIQITAGRDFLIQSVELELLKGE